MALVIVALGACHLSKLAIRVESDRAVLKPSHIICQKYVKQYMKHMSKLYQNICQTCFKHMSNICQQMCQTYVNKCQQTCETYVKYM